METHKHVGYNAWQKRGDDVRALIQRLQYFILLEYSLKAV
jgi:hypothetical protein